MGMANGVGTGRTVSEINVTPLIDVLLVLLIIFMVIVPVTPKGLGALIPQAKSADPAPETIVVSLAANGSGEPSYRINQEALPKAEIEPRLEQIFAARRDKAMFVRADESIEFSRVAEVIDMGHQAQVDNIGLMKAAAER
jgi:biopolymer transport protein TolR